MFLNLEYEEIFPYVCVYKNLINKPEDIHNVLKHSLQLSEENPDKNFGLFPKWTDWFVFGKYVSILGDELLEPESEEDLLDPHLLHKREMMITLWIKEARIAAISHYIGKYNVPQLKESQIQQAINIGMYYSDTCSDSMENNSLTMQYHTDYRVDQIEQECFNMLLTCNFYFNDDYDGGEISFYAYGKKFDYKPKAGDVIVFPSGSPLFPGNEPYFHAVKKIENGNKFIARNYLMYKQDASDNWLKNEALHGKEKWASMEKSRIENENIQPNLIMFHNDVKMYNKVIDEHYWSKNGNV
jgi:predicted 2-oxoglutarate/Fe(II)-dependent dioxygenase YbiX